MKFKYILSFILAAVLFGGTIAWAAPFPVATGGTGVMTIPATQLIVGNGTSPIYTIATTSVTCSGSTSCTPFTVIGPSPITITSSGGGGTPGGLNTQIQYNNSGSFGGITGAVTDGTAVSLTGAHLLNPTINGAGTGLATLTYPNTSSNSTITFPTVTGTLATLAGSEALTNKSVNGVTLTAAGSATAYLDGTGNYSVPPAGAYPFALTGNATSTLTQFNGGLTAYATSTIGNGTQANGLTISGGATTTGNAYFANGSAAAPSIAFSANPTTGLSNSAGTISISSAGTARLLIGSGLNFNSSSVTNGSIIQSGNAGGYQLFSGTGASVTAPIFIPDRGDTTTGFAAGVAGNINAIIGGVEKVRWTSVGEGIGSSTPFFNLSVGSNNVGNFGISTTTAGCAQFSPMGEVYSTGTNCGTGGVTSIAIASANGFTGSSSGGATPTITLTTSVTSNVLKGNGTAIVSAANGTDYTLLSAQSCSAGSFVSALTASGGSTCTAGNTGTVTSVSGTTNQISSTGGTTPILSLPSLVIFPGNASTSQISAAQGFFNTFAATSTTATSTVAWGLNVATSGGCLAVNGTCVSTGGGTVTGTGANTRVAFWNGASSLTSGADFTFNSGGRLSLGQASGVEQGQVLLFGNNTGSATLQPNLSASGTYTLSLPAVTGNLAALELAQTFTTTQTFSASPTSALFSNNVGIGTTSPYAQLSLGGGNLVIGAATAGGTPGDLFLPKLGTAAGSFIAVDPTGKVIATSTPSGSNSAFSPAANYATTGALPSNTYNNGTAGVGATITEVGTGALSVDGNSPAVGQRVLVKNEGTAANNGLYSVTVAGSGIAAFVLTRDTAYNSSNTIIPGIVTYVISGATLADDFWAMTSASPITVGTTALNYVEVSGGGAGVASVSNSDSTITFSPTTGAVVGSLNINHSNIWTALQVFNASIGVSSSTPFSALSVGTGAASSSITVAEYKYGKSGNVATSTAQNIDCNASTQIAEPIGTSATTLTLINLTPGKKCIVVVQNPNNTAGAVTWAVQSNAILKWAGGTIPTQTTTANTFDIWSFLATQGSSTMEVIGAATLNN